jgi:hypothetical protein
VWQLVGSFDEHNGAFTALFTIVLSISTIGLWRATNKLWEAGERQIEVAGRSADVAERALTFTERAFVFLKYMYVSPVFRPDQTVVGWDFHVVWENSGSTPTQFMYARKQWMLFPDGNIPEDFDFPDLGNLSNSLTFIGPKAIVDAGGLQISNVDLFLIANGPARLLIWGWTEYNDVFTPDTRRRSEFCSEIIVAGALDKAPDERTKEPFIFMSYKMHNGTENECYRKPFTTAPKVK